MVIRNTIVRPLRIALFFCKIINPWKKRNFPVDQNVVCGSIKIKKLPSPDVWDRKMFLKCRMISSFVSAFRYYRKEASKHTWYVVAPNKKFWGTTQSHTPSLQKYIFLRTQNLPILKVHVRESQKMFFCDEDVCAWVVSKNILLGATTYHVCLQAFLGSYLNTETN